MDWFSLLFAGAFVFALLTGKAYFRGLINRDSDPRRYWFTVGTYLLLGALTYYAPHLKPAFNIASDATSFKLSNFFSDAATRLAYDIEEGVGSMQRSGAQSRTIEHIPLSEPNGCAQDFTLQLESNIIVVWCKDAVSGATTSSHSTSYHGRFATAAKVFMLNKRVGEPVYLDITASGAKALIANVR